MEFKEICKNNWDSQIAELQKEVKFEYILHMQKNIVLNMMKVRDNHSIFKEARVNLIL